MSIARYARLKRAICSGTSVAGLGVLNFAPRRHCVAFMANNNSVIFERKAIRLEVRAPNITPQAAA